MFWHENDFTKKCDKPGEWGIIFCYLFCRRHVTIFTFFCFDEKGQSICFKVAVSYKCFPPFWGNLSQKYTTIFSEISTAMLNWEANIYTFGRKLYSFVWQKVTLKVTRFKQIYIAKQLWLNRTILEEFNFINNNSDRFCLLWLGSKFDKEGVSR